MFHHISSIPERREKRRDYDHHDATSFAWKPETVNSATTYNRTRFAVSVRPLLCLAEGRDDLSSSRSLVTTFRQVREDRRSRACGCTASTSHVCIHTHRASHDTFRSVLYVHFSFLEKDSWRLDNVLVLLATGQFMKYYHPTGRKLGLRDKSQPG